MSLLSGDNKKLSVPAWVPPAVAKRAAELYEKARRQGMSEHAELIQRLTLSRDMRFVWQELQSKSRKTGEFKYRVLFIDPSRTGSDRENLMRGLALQEVFSTAVHLGGLLRTSESSSKQRIASVKRLQLHFEQVVGDLAETFSHHPMPARYSRLSEAGLKIIAKLEELAAEDPPFDLNSLSAQVVVVGLSHKLNDLFAANETAGGEDLKIKETRPRPLLSGIIALAASAILQRPIDRDQIRDWKSGFWGGGIVGA